ncbi:MAG: DUF1294 domain-containing protein [Oscillospiraceae bacterium]|nr:DUF1294 domain-containing protein [Oscillospiraceae bacterium]
MILKIICAWLLLWSLVAFIAMGADKRKARKGKWRVPEATLFLFALLGGGLGATLGMHVFHHKTKHWYFRWGLPLILLVQLVLVIWLSLHFGLRWNG